MTARLLTVVDSDFALDGGAMMGIVPRPLWERAHPPDDRNRIALVSRLAIVDDRGHGRLWLLDCGLGRDWSPRDLDIYAIRPRGGDVRSLVASAGFDPDDVSDVVLTHLHFDHVAGLARNEGSGRRALAFPRASHHLQEAHWVWARSPSAKDAGSFRPEYIEVLGSSDRLHLVDGDVSLGGAVSVRTASGHSAGMQIPIVETDAGVHVFCADLVPTWSHVRVPWVMAYDNEPVRTLADKTRLLGDASDRDWVLVSEHDPRAARARVLRDAKPGTFKAEMFSTPDDR